MPVTAGRGPVFECGCMGAFGLQDPRGGAQVIVATHSPVVAALPGARILELGEWGMREAQWEDTQLVVSHRAFLASPQRLLDGGAGLRDPAHTVRGAFAIGVA